MWDFKQYADSVAVLDEYEKSISYSELDEEGKKLVTMIKHRCLVFLLCKNSIGAVLGYTAFINGRVPPVLLNAHLDDELLEHLLDVYKPSLMWIPEEQVKQFPQMSVLYSAYDYALLKTPYHEEYSIYEELALLLTTSGSTGSPKFVRQSYTNIFDNSKSISKYLQLDKQERPITTLPMNYTYGLSIINSHLLVGATILVTDKGLMQKDFWNFFKTEKATSFGGVPYTYEMLDKLRFYRMNLPSLRTMTQAGGKLLPELHERFARYADEEGKKFVVMYGQCEATARMGFLPPEKAVEKKGSMGIAIPGGRFYLIDDNGNRVTEPYSSGELVYEGKNVTLGYAESKNDLAKGDERHGVLKTGDMAQFDEDGYYYIVGRKKRFLKIYGNRVNLDEVERLVKGEFDTEAACSGSDDHLCIFITEQEIKDEAKRYIAQKTGLNMAAFEIRVIDSIPKNDSGKILYKELDQYCE